MARCGPKREGSVWVRPVFTMSLFVRRLARPTLVCFSAVRRSVWIRCPPRDPFARCRGPVSESHVNPAVASRCSHSNACAALFSGAQVRASRGSAGSRRRAPSSNASLDSRSAERAQTLSETRPSAPAAPRKKANKGRVWGVSPASHAKPLPTQSRLRPPQQEGGVGALHAPRKTTK